MCASDIETHQSIEQAEKQKLLNETLTLETTTMS